MMDWWNQIMDWWNQLTWFSSWVFEVFYYYFFIIGPNAMLLIGVVLLFFENTWKGVVGFIGWAFLPSSIIAWVFVRSPYLGDIPAGARMSHQMAEHIYQVYQYVVPGMDYGAVFWIDLVTVFVCLVVVARR